MSHQFNMSFFARWIRAKSNQRYKLLTCLTTPSGSVHTLAISNDGQLIACSVPKSVVFAENRDIYVFGLYDGNFITLEGIDGTVAREFSCHGHAAVSLKRGLFVIDNVMDGFTMYRLENKREEPIRTFMTAVLSMSVPQQTQDINPIEYPQELLKKLLVAYQDPP
ncbi:hypothetical protein BDR06DRAFT_971118 [Suillus hirtellus]|nr:hypothetical protein BDR06DRAFT_971118 [Suillus hirtellus]